jgi:hypothetical protein
MVEDARRYGEITIEHHSMEGLAHRSISMRMSLMVASMRSF